MAEFNLTLGDVVRIADDAPVARGEIAYVYDTYPDFEDDTQLGVSLITETGDDTGGWSKQEQLEFLEPLGHSGWDYEFHNVIQLEEDFKNGVFNQIFKKYS